MLELGRQGGLKIRCPQGRVGSIPTRGTSFLYKSFEDFKNKPRREYTEKETAIMSEASANLQRDELKKLKKSGNKR